MRRIFRQDEIQRVLLHVLTLGEQTFSVIASDSHGSSRLTKLNNPVLGDFPTCPRLAHSGGARIRVVANEAPAVAGCFSDCLSCHEQVLVECFKGFGFAIGQQDELFSPCPL